MNSNRVGRMAIILAAVSVLATVALYSFALVPLLLLGVVAVTPSRPVFHGALGVFLAIAVVRIALVHRLAPHEQAFLRFWVHAPFFIFLVACTLGSVPILIAVSAGQSLGWSPGIVSWVVRVIGLGVLVSSSLFVHAPWRRHTT
jgi:hypothetical protein